MKNVTRRSPAGVTATEIPVDLYIIPGPRSTSAEFCSVVLRALRCRSCALVLIGPNGDVLVNDAIGQASDFLALAGTRDSVAAGEDGRQRRPRTVVSVDTTAASISLPLVLPDGITGFLTVADREDGSPFSTSDRELLEHLTAFYSSTFETPARREALRLRSDLQILRKKAIQAEESERQRLARELHDDVGHALTTAILSFDMTAQSLPAGGVAVKALTAARDSLTECVDCLNEFAFQLRPRVLNDLGLAPALRGLARRVGESCDLDISVEIHGRERRLSDETELAAFRVAQEALTNALKHARASRITITVAFAEDSLDIEISDDGAGFDPASAVPDRRHHGQGLLGMRERAELAGGILDLRSTRGVGTTVRAWLPVWGGR